MSSVEDVAISPVSKNDEPNARKFIAELLASSACPPYTMNLEQLDGYLHAVAAEPNPTSPETWMPLIFGGEFPCFIEGYSTLGITNALICLYNSHRTQVLNNHCTLSFPYEYSDDRTKRIQAEQWRVVSCRVISFGRIFGANF